MIHGVLFAWWFLMRIDYNGVPGQQTVAQGPFPSKEFCERAEKQYFPDKDGYSDMQGHRLWMRLNQNINPGEAEGGALLEPCSEIKDDH